MFFLLSLPFRSLRVRCCCRSLLFLPFLLLRV